ncbi:TPA: hypothetical protein EYP66_07925 [Candidatus Poribacteria bacterium]|nr:hypothetical protein [Candidatus Poribacteria bacterium]
MLIKNKRTLLHLFGVLALLCVYAFLTPQISLAKESPLAGGTIAPEELFEAVSGDWTFEFTIIALSVLLARRSCLIYSSHCFSSQFRTEKV